MSTPGPTKEEYGSLIYRLATLESELGQARKLLEAAAKQSGWWKRCWGMGAKAAAVALVVVCFVGAVALGQGSEPYNIEIHDGFYTGNEYVKLEKRDKTEYVMGLVDGLYLSPMFGAQKRNLRWVERCTEGKINVELVAIIDQFLQENPERWHEGMHILAYSALAKAFRK